MTAPALIQRLVAIAHAAQTAEHGTKDAIYSAAMAELSLSKATLMRKLKEVSTSSPRKRRSDAGSVTLTKAEAMKVSAVLIESTRKNGKRIMSIKQSIDILRSNGLIAAERVDSATGEVMPLSVTAIIRSLHIHKVHPDQLLATEPVTRMKSNHPNHVWQIDASLCVLYYLPKEASQKETGLQVMAHDVFYKNKPGNIKRIENDTVWRYVVTDHTSGWLYVEYVTGGETGQNLCNIFINAIQKRAKDPAHGVPLMVMLDPGSANTSGIFKNLCKALSVQVQINTPGRPRAKGQVEQAQNLVETSFESGLKFVAINCLATLNQAAHKWMFWFNSTAVHTRHQMTRYEAWLHINAEQLRIAPSVEICRELSVTAPITRKVSPVLCVSFKGDEYDVSGLDDVMVGESILVCRNPWRDDAVQVVTQKDGREVFYVAERVNKDAFGFAEDAAVFGENYKRHQDTPAQTNAKAIEQLLTGSDTLVDAKAARKAKQLAFDGKLDPFKPQKDSIAPTYFTQRGTASEVNSPIVEIKPWSHTKVAMELVKRGVVMTPERSRMIARWYPDGVPEPEIDKLETRMLSQPALRAVDG